MRMQVRKFMDWWEALPLIVAILFVPIVMIIAVIAFIKNRFQGDKK